MIQRRKPLKRSTKPIARRVRPKAKRKGTRRGPAGVDPERWRNKEYLRFLREEGRCVACRQHPKWRWHPCDPAHGPVNGTSSKGPDAGAIPMCRGHHDEQTEIGWQRFEERYAFSREREAAVWFAAFNIWKEAQG